jgi:leucyl-tRNA synthetase
MQLTSGFGAGAQHHARLWKFLYWMRYMDAAHENEFTVKTFLHIGKNVDLYIGGRSNATGHLLYSRFEQILKIKVLHPLKNHSKKN